MKSPWNTIRNDEWKLTSCRRIENGRIEHRVDDDATQLVPMKFSKIEMSVEVNRYIGIDENRLYTHIKGEESLYGWPLL